MVKKTIQEDTDSRWIPWSGSDRSVISILIQGTANKPPQQPIFVKILGL